MERLREHIAQEKRVLARRRGAPGGTGAVENRFRGNGHVVVVCGGDLEIPVFIVAVSGAA